jgi:hypothetical protein
VYIHLLILGFKLSRPCDGVHVSIKSTLAGSITVRTFMNSVSLSPPLPPLSGNDVPPCMYPEEPPVEDTEDTEAVDGAGDTVSSLSEKESPQFKKKFSNGHIHSTCKYGHLLVAISLISLPVYM